MKEKEFIEMMEKLMNAFGTLEFMPGWTPYRALEEVKKSGILSLLPDSMTFSVCSSMDGRLLVESKVQSFHTEYDCYYNKECKKYSVGELEYFMPDCREFRVWLNATPETARVAADIKQMNENAEQLSHQYLKQYMKNITAYAERVDVFSLNNGSEKMYSVHSGGWVKQPCVLSVDVRSAFPEWQSCKVSVPYAQLSEDLAGVTMKLESMVLPIEDSYHRVVELASEDNVFVHNISFSYEEESCKVLCDGFELYNFKDYEIETYDEVYESIRFSDALERDIAAIAQLDSEDDVKTVLRSGPYSDSTIAETVMRKKEEAKN